MASARPLIDHDEIREWAEERRARPACVKGTGGKGDPGMIRLDFPGFSGKQSLAPISWDRWFKAFDENGLALMVQEQTARGQSSNFNKLVSRSSASGRGRRGGRSRSRSSGRQGTRRQSERGSRPQSKSSRSSSPRTSRQRSTQGARKRTASGARRSTSSGGRATAAERSGAAKRSDSSSRKSSSRRKTGGRGRK